MTIYTCRGMAELFLMVTWLLLQSAVSGFENWFTSRNWLRNSDFIRLQHVYSWPSDNLSLISFGCANCALAC